MARSKSKNDKNDKQKKPKVHKDLEGFDVEIDSFGEIKTRFDLNKINRFLDKHVQDKKFRGIDVERVDEVKEEGKDEEE